MSVLITDGCDEGMFLDTVRIHGLLQYNMQQTHGKLKVPDVALVNAAWSESGLLVGGVAGCTYLSALEIEVLWVHEDYRRQQVASRLLEEIERRAKEAGCGLSHLTSYSFQAPHFYQKHGYTICGEVDGFPDDIRLYTLKKQL